MARTIRRKNKKSNFAQLWANWHEFSRDWYRNRYPELSDEDIIHREDVKDHMDNHSGIYTCPNYYGKELNKKIKKKNTLLLIRTLRNGLEDDFVPHPIKKDSGYNYF